MAAPTFWWRSRQDREWLACTRCPRTSPWCALGVQERRPGVHSAGSGRRQTVPVHILVADDDHAVRESLRRSLAFNGYEVTTANDGQEALEVLDATSPDLVLLDVNMPRLDGLETCRRMRAAGTIASFLALGGLIAGRIGPAMTDLDLYPVAAATVAIGVLMLAFSEWQMRRVAAWIPLTFALSLVVGSIGTFVAGTSALFILSGILFGCAFAAMTISVL